jgi:flagella basal body P-ring formation protein FlgA
LQQVRLKLSKKDVNWAKVSLSGFLQCKVSRGASNPTAATNGQTEGAGSTLSETAEAPAPGAASNIQRSVKAGQAATLRQRVQRLIEQMAEAKAKNLRVKFSKRDAEKLDRTVIGKRYELEPQTASPLGRLPIRVRRYANKRIKEQFTISANVEHRAKALVAKDTIHRDRRLRKNQFTVQHVWLSDDPKPLSDSNLIKNQRADATLGKGQPLYPEDVKSPTLVERGQLITVRCLSDGLVVRTVARAMDEGSRNDMIKVRNESSRETFTCKVTGPRRAVVDLNGRSSDASNDLAAAEGAR